MRNTFVYSSSIKICASGFDQRLESIFCLLQVVEAYSLQKVFEMLEEVVVGEKVNIMDEAKLHRPMHSMFEALVVPCEVRFVVQKNWALSVDQWWLQEFQFLVHLIDLLNILPR